MLDECRWGRPGSRRMVSFTFKREIIPLSDHRSDKDVTQHNSDTMNTHRVLTSFATSKFTSFFSDLLRYMLNSSTLLTCKSLMARIWSPLWNRHTVCGWPVHPNTLWHTHTYMFCFLFCSSHWHNICHSYLLITNYEMRLWVKLILPFRYSIRQSVEKFPLSLNKGAATNSVALCELWKSLPFSMNDFNLNWKYKGTNIFDKIIVCSTAGLL